jgi:ABC-type uncharacterized transport system substrate-binding protein
MRRMTAVLSGVIAALALASLTMPAQAHPHVWVVARTTVLYENGRATGLRHEWTFDEAYTAMAIEGLDKNGDGIYSREELAELAQVNMDGLKEFDYFTYAKHGEEKIKLKSPVDYYLEHKNGILTLYFTMPFEAAVPTTPPPLTFQVYDPSFFIAFEFAKDGPIALKGAPTGCHASLAIPQKEQEELDRLAKAFGGPMTAGNANMGMGMGYAKTVTLACGKP